MSPDKLFSIRPRFFQMRPICAETEAPLLDKSAARDHASSSIVGEEGDDA